jgi:hypothetical protein
MGPLHTIPSSEERRGARPNHFAPDQLIRVENVVIFFSPVWLKSVYSTTKMHVHWIIGLAH